MVEAYLADNPCFEVLVAAVREAQTEPSASRSRRMDDQQPCRSCGTAREVIDRTPEWIAAAAGGRLSALGGATDGRSVGPRTIEYEAAEAGSGDLFVALAVEGSDAGQRAALALSRGAWGVLISAEDQIDLRAFRRPVIVVEDPVRALQRLAQAWRRELGCTVVGITGSAGKTSTKDILAAVLAGHRRTHATPGNYNNTIGLPISILGAERGTEVLVLEMAAGDRGGIAALAEIAEPDVGVIVSIGPAHLTTFKTLTGVAWAKGVLIWALPPGGSCVVPVDQPLLERYVRDDVRTLRFGPGGDVALRSYRDGVAEIDVCGKPVTLELSFGQAHQLRNTLAAVAAATALGVAPAGRIEPSFSPFRGELVQIAEGISMIRDCYSANPLSMRAALEHLAATPAERRIAVLGRMAGLGTDSDRYHLEVGEYTQSMGVSVLITVGEQARLVARGFRGEKHETASPEDAATVLRQLMRPGDLILVKGWTSHAEGLTRLTERLTARDGCLRIEDELSMRVAVLSGGRSSEREASLVSGASVREGLEAAGHIPIPIDVGRDGVWRRNGDVVVLEPGGGLAGVDVVFPALHGPFGEDGTVQGLLECLDVPYVGAGVLGSALCMDKVVFKDLMASAGMPQADYRPVRVEHFRSNRDAVLERLRPLGFPAFVKPAHLGSSVGVTRVDSPETLPGALELAFQHGPLAIVEEAVTGVEVECAVIGNGEPIVSQPGEIVLVAGEPGWLDYETKYTPGSVHLIVPAGVPKHVRERIQALAVSTFLRTGCNGLARVDFFVDGERVLVNEINTMPFLNKTNAFSMLFQNSGISYPELLDRLLDLALERHAARRQFAGIGGGSVDFADPPDRSSIAERTSSS